MESVLETIRQSELVELGSERDIFFETPPNDVVDSISKYFESSVSQHSNQPHSQASDSDSGSSLFLTQSVTSVCRTVRRHQSSQRPAPPFPVESDADSEGDDGNKADKDERPGSLSQRESHSQSGDGDLFGGPQERPALPADQAAKRRIRSRKWKHAPVQSKFPFLKNSRSEQLSTHKNQVLVNAEIGGFFKCIKTISEDRGQQRRELSPKRLEDDYDSMEWGTDEDVRIVDKESFISITHKRNRQKWLPAARLKAKQMLEKSTKKKKSNIIKVSKETKKTRNKSGSRKSARLARKVTQSSEYLLTDGSDNEIGIAETQNPDLDQATEEAGETSAPEILEHESTDDGEDRVGLEKILFREQERDEDSVEDKHHEQLENKGLIPDQRDCIGSQDHFAESDATVACSSLKETRIRDGNEKDKEICAVQSDERNSFQKMDTVEENHSETFLHTEAGSDSDSTNISELQRTPCHVPQFHEKTSPEASENRKAKKDKYSMTLAQSEDNEPLSLPTQSLADDLLGSKVNANLSSRKDLHTGVLCSSPEVLVSAAGPEKQTATVLSSPISKEVSHQDSNTEMNMDTCKNIVQMQFDEENIQVETDQLKSTEQVDVQDYMQETTQLVPKKKAKKEKRKERDAEENLAVAISRVGTTEQFDAPEMIQHSEHHSTESVLEKKAKKKKRREQVVEENLTGEVIQVEASEPFDALEMIPHSVKKKKKKKRERVDKDNSAAQTSQVVATELVEAPEVIEDSQHQGSELVPDKKGKKKKNKSGKTIGENVQPSQVASIERVDHLELIQEMEKGDTEFVPEKELKRKKKRAQVVKEHVEPETSNMKPTEHIEALEGVEDSEQQATEMVSRKKKKKEKKKKREQLVEENDLDQASKEALETSAPEILAHGLTDDEDRVGLEKILFREQERDEDSVEEVHHEQQENKRLVPDSGVCIGSQDHLEESDATVASTSLKETRISKEKDKEGCAVQNDGRHLIQKISTVEENNSETFLDTEACSDADNTNISELHVPHFHEKTSPVANDIRKAKKDKHKKAPVDSSLTLTQSEKNETSSLPTQSLNDYLFGSRVNANSGSWKDLTTGVQSETAMETGGQWLFNLDGFSMIKRRKMKKPQTSELLYSSNSDASQNGGLSQHEKVSRHKKRKQSTLLVEDSEGKERACKRAAEEPVEAFPFNSVSALALSTDIVQDSESNAAEVAKRKRDGNLPSFPQGIEETCLEEKSEISCSASEVLVSAAEPEKQTATVLCSPISNKVSHQDSNTEIKMDTCKNIDQLDKSEPLNVKKSQMMSETVECMEHTESGLEQESFLENSAGTQTRFDQSRSDNLTEPLNNSDIISNTLKQVSCLNFKADDFISPRKKEKRKKEEAVRDDVAVKVGQVETSENSELILDESISKKKKKKVCLHEENLAVQVETDQLESTEQQTTELVAKKKAKKKKRKEKDAEEKLPVEITQVETTEQFDAPEMFQHHNTELVLAKKAKKKKRKEKDAEENLPVAISRVGTTEQFDAPEMIQHSEHHSSESVLEKKAKKKKRREQVVENLTGEVIQVEASEPFDALEMIPHSVKKKKKKKRERVDKDNSAAQTSQVVATELVEAPEVIEDSPHQGSELVPDKKVKKKKNKSGETIGENVPPSQVASIERVDHLELIQETEKRDTELVPEKELKRKKKRAQVVKEIVALETSNMEVTEHIEALEGVEDSEQQATEMVSRKKKKKEKKKKREQLVEENVLDHHECLEVAQEFEQRTPKVTPVKKVKRKWDRSSSQDTEVTQEQEDRRTPCATSKNMFMINAYGSFMTTDSSSPRTETYVIEEGSSAGLDWEDRHCPPGFGGSSFLKKKKKKRKEKDNDSSVSDGMGQK